MKGPGYTIDDLVYWVGFIGVAASVSLTLMATMPEWHPLVRVLLSIGCGVAGGLGASRLWAMLKQPPRPPDDEEIRKDRWT